MHDEAFHQPDLPEEELVKRASRMSFQCQYVNTLGVRCGANALHRLYFSAEHPFGFVDACAEHRAEYKHYCREEPLQSYESEESEDVDFNIDLMSTPRKILAELRRKGEL